MNKFPDIIQAYLGKIFIEKNQFSYLVLNEQNQVIGWQGNIYYYGLFDLNIGDIATERLFFLTGLLPYQSSEFVVLPFVNFNHNVVADIHILSDENLTYILFFDVTIFAKQQQKIQQDHHNIELLYEQQEKNLVIIKQTHEELELKSKQAEIANKEKTNLLSYISHDLRTPLNVILGMSQLLDANIFGELNENQKESISKILNAGYHMNELINQLLEESRLESGSVGLNLESISANALIAESIDLLQPLANQQKISIFNKTRQDIDIKVDKQYFKQIIINIVNNAIKYNREQGCIIISTNILAEHLHIIIKDTGIGMNHQQMEKIFRPFSRVLDKDKADKIDGYGIGLNRCKQLVEIMHGFLTVWSELDIGSVFYINLPLAEPHNQIAYSQQIVYVYQQESHFELFYHLLTSYDDYQIFGINQGDEIPGSIKPPTIIFFEIDNKNLSANIEQLKSISCNKESFIVAVFDKQTTPAIISDVLYQLEQCVANYILRPFDLNQILDVIQS